MADDTNEIVLQFKQVGLDDVANDLQAMFDKLASGGDASQIALAQVVEQLKAIVDLSKSQNNGVLSKEGLLDTYRTTLSASDRKAFDKKYNVPEPPEPSEPAEPKGKPGEEKGHFNFAETAEKTIGGVTSSISAAKEAAEALNNLSFDQAIAAFEELNKAAQETLSVFGRLGTAIGEILGTIGAIAAGTAAAGYAIFEFSHSAAEAGVQLHEFAAAAGSSMEDMLALQGVFAEAGASTDNFANSLANLNMRLAAEWPEALRQVRDTGAKLEESQIGVRNAAIEASGAFDQVAASAIKVQQAQISVAETAANADNAWIKTKQTMLDYRSAQDAVASSSLSVGSAFLGLARAQENLRILQGGRRDSRFEEWYKEQSAIQAVQEAQLRLQEAYRQQERSVLQLRLVKQQLINASNEEKKAALDAAQARLSLNAALREEAQAGDKARLLQLQKLQAERAYADQLQKSAPIVAEALRGQAGEFAELTKQIDLSKVEVIDLFRAVELNAGRIAAQNKGVDGLVQPGALDMLKALSAAMHTLTDNTQKLALARQALGRFFGQAQTEALEEIIKKFEHVKEAEGAFFKDVEKTYQPLNELVVSVKVLEHTLEGLRLIFAAPFASIFSAELQSLNEYILHNYKTIEAFAQNLATKLKPYIHDFFNLLKGEKIETPWINQVVTGVKEIGAIILQVGKVIGEFATKINDVVTSTVGWNTAIEIFVGLKLLDSIKGLVSPLWSVVDAFTKLAGISWAAWGATALAGIGPLLTALAGIALAVGAIYAAIKLYENSVAKDNALNPSKATAKDLEREQNIEKSLKSNRDFVVDQINKAGGDKEKEAQPFVATLKEIDEQLAQNKVRIERLQTQLGVDKKKETEYLHPVNEKQELIAALNQQIELEQKSAKELERSIAFDLKQQDAVSLKRDREDLDALNKQIKIDEEQRDLLKKQLDILQKEHKDKEDEKDKKEKPPEPGSNAALGINTSAVTGGHPPAEPHALPAGERQSVAEQVTRGVVAANKEITDKKTNETKVNVTPGGIGAGALNRAGQPAGTAGSVEPIVATTEDRGEYKRTTFSTNKAALIHVDNQEVGGPGADSEKIVPRAPKEFEPIPGGVHITNERTGQVVSQLGKLSEATDRAAKALDDFAQKALRQQFDAAEKKFEDTLATPASAFPTPLEGPPVPTTDVLPAYEPLPASPVAPVVSGPLPPAKEEGNYWRSQITDAAGNAAGRVATDFEKLSNAITSAVQGLTQLGSKAGSVPAKQASSSSSSSSDDGGGFAEGGIVGFENGGLVVRGFAAGGMTDPGYWSIGNTDWLKHHRINQGDLDKSPLKMPKKLNQGDLHIRGLGIKDLDIHGLKIPKKLREFAQPDLKMEHRTEGGFFRGKGTTKSDSNIVALSDREYIVNADATAHYGVDMLDMINKKKFADGGFLGASNAGSAFGGPFTDFIQMIQTLATNPIGANGYFSNMFGSNLGDMVSRLAGRAAPREFGLAGHHRLDISTNQGAFSALVSDQTMQSLQRGALSAKLTSTGTKPSWYT